MRRAPRSGPQDDLARLPAAVLAVLALSSACALANELLWTRVLTASFGGTHAAEAVVLGVFFAGVAAGSLLGAPLVAAARGTLWRRYAFCELVTGGAALLPLWVAHAGGGFAAALAALLPAVLAAGAAWPLLLALSGARGGAVGRFCAAGAAGAVGGCLLTTFVLVEQLGLRVSLLGSASLSLLLAVAAWVVGGRRAEEPAADAGDGAPEAAGAGALADRAAPWVAGAAAGALLLGYEVLATRVFALRLPHTVYSTGTVLAGQLVGMTAGGLLAQRLVVGGARTLGRLVLAAGGALAATPVLAGLWGPPARSASWSGELGRALLEVGCALGPAALLLGTVFPLAAALLSRDGGGRPPAERVGRLAALDAAAGLAGALGVGFGLVPLLGTGGGLAALGLLAAALGAGIALRARRRASAPRSLWSEGALGAVTLLAVAGAAGFEGTLLLPGERVVAARDGPAASLAVVEDESGGRRLVANGRYTLGDSDWATTTRRLGLLPSLLRPGARRTFLLGYGTGITAGGAADAASVHGGEVTAAELLPEAPPLAAHFERWGARRAEPRVVAGDGRQVLAADGAGWDLVVFDLLLPWRPGTAHLYTLECFALARSRLRPGGTCGVWLPLFQLSPRSLAGVLRTFTEVFPRAVLYGGSLDPERPLLLVTSRPVPGPRAERARARLAAEGLLAEDPVLAVPGGVDALALGPAPAAVDALAREAGVRAPLHRDDRPWVAYDAPRARARGRLVRGERFRRLVVAPAPAPRSPAARAVRAAWRDPAEALELLRPVRSDPEAAPLIARVARRASGRAFASDRPALGGELAAVTAHAARGEARARALAVAVRERRRADRRVAAMGLLEALAPERLSRPWWRPAFQAAELALEADRPAAALGWLERLPPSAAPARRGVLAALAHDRAGRRDEARAALASARRADPHACADLLRRLGVEAWASELRR